MNPFEKLGLPGTATPQQVTAAWRKLCMIHHPDRGGTDAKFCEIQAAYKEAFSQASRPRVRKATLSAGAYNMNRADVQAAMRQAYKTAFCKTCRGLGRVPRSRGFSTILVNCPDCNGAKGG